MSQKLNSTNSIADILDRPVSFHRCLARLAGSVHAGLMLSQALYWSSRTKDPDGWFWKKQEEWYEETMLTRWEQEAARKLLRKTGVWEEALRGIPAKLYFKIDVTVLTSRLLNMNNGGDLGGSGTTPKDGAEPPTSMGCDHQPVCGDTTYKHAARPHANTETTAEITNNPPTSLRSVVPPWGTARPSPTDDPGHGDTNPQSSLSPPLAGATSHTQAVPPIPKGTTACGTHRPVRCRAPKPPNQALLAPLVEGLDLEAWTEFVTFRSAIRKPIHQASAKAAQTRLLKFGSEAMVLDGQLAVVRQSIANGWKGLFALKQETSYATHQRIDNSAVARVERATAHLYQPEPLDGASHSGSVAPDDADLRPPLDVSVWGER